MPEDFRHSPLVRGCNVAQYSIKLCTYDPVIIDAFDRLRKNRKQAAFTHEALKQFLSTEKGGQVLQLMEGKATTEPYSASIPLRSDTILNETPAETKVIKALSVLATQNDSGSVLDCILE
jgi:hypothetical protein